VKRRKRSRRLLRATGFYWGARRNRRRVGAEYLRPRADVALWGKAGVARKGLGRERSRTLLCTV
jgi:hypothetical protein